MSFLPSPSRDRGDRIVTPANLLALPVRAARPTWSLTVPTSFAPKPLFNFGDFVSLDEKLQPTEGVTYFGRIIGLWFEKYEDCSYWQYCLEISDDNPEAENNDYTVIYQESEVVELMKG